MRASKLLALAPHLVKLERFLFPVYGWPLVHRAFMGAGLTLYDLLGAARDGGRAHHLGSDAVAELIPNIKRDGLRGGVTYRPGSGVLLTAGYANITNSVIRRACSKSMRMARKPRHNRVTAATMSTIVLR